MPVATNDGNIERTVGDLPVLRPSGEAVRLGEAWAERPVVLALMRHFGCVFCKDQVAQLQRIVEAIHVAGAELVIVGSGSPQMAGFFAEDYHVTTPVLTDPTRAVYGALELRRPSALSFLDPRVIWQGAQAVLLHGHMQQPSNAERGDREQLGGVFIVRPGGDVAWAYRSEFAGDHPSNEAVLAALRASMAAAA